MKKLAWIIFGGLCVAISFYPVAYLLAEEPIALLLSKPFELVTNNVYNIFFYSHIVPGGIALLVGWLQFSKKLRRKSIKAHRIIGKIYVAAVFISGPAGLYIAYYATGGLSPKLGFSIGAILWVVLTYLGLSTVRKGNIEAHRKYMMYSYAGTFGAVTLRLWLPLLIIIFGGFKPAYQIVAWLSWVPNMIVVYFILNHRTALITIYRKYRVKKILIGFIVLTSLTLGISCLSPHTWFYKAPTIDGIAFQRSGSLENSSFTAAKIEELNTYLKEESETTSMLVLENGKIVYEYGDISKISYLASCRKSILAILYGKHVLNGTIDLNETIGEIGIDEDDGLLDIEKSATVDHIITATSGVFHLPANGGYDTDNVRARGSVAPGEYFLYNNWDFNVAGAILEQKTGNSVYEELEQQLAIPLGFQDWNIENQKRSVNEEKSRYSAYHMHLSTRDMAKIGQLMLQEGTWKEKQLVSKEWINKITHTVTPTDTINLRNRSDSSSPVQHSYGYMWWLYERFYDNPDFEGAYTAWGAAGQYITVIPKRNVVIAHKTTRDLFTIAGLSNRTKTPDWRYWWILRNLMMNRKNIEDLANDKSIDQIVAFLEKEYDQDSEYAISERLINEFALKFSDETKYDKAIKLFELNLRLYPQGYYTHRTLDYYAECLQKLGKNKEALDAFERSLELNPNNFKTKKAIVALKKEMDL